MLYPQSAPTRAWQPRLAGDAGPGGPGRPEEDAPTVIDATVIQALPKLPSSSLCGPAGAGCVGRPLLVSGALACPKI